MGLCALGLAVLTGCVGLTVASQTIEPSDIAGSWEATVDGHEIDLQISRSGTAHIQNLPLGALSTDDETLNWSTAVDVTGDWQIANHRVDSGYPWFSISLDGLPTVDLDDTTIQFFLHKVGDDAKLHLIYGPVDVDRRIIFEPV